MKLLKRYFSQSLTSTAPSTLFCTQLSQLSFSLTKEVPKTLLRESSKTDFFLLDIVEFTSTSSDLFLENGQLLMEYCAHIMIYVNGNFCTASVTSLRDCEK